MILSAFYRKFHGKKLRYLPGPVNLQKVNTQKNNVQHMGL